MYSQVHIQVYIPVCMPVYMLASLLALAGGCGWLWRLCPAFWLHVSFVVCVFGHKIMADQSEKKKATGKRKKTPADFLAAKEANAEARRKNTLTQWIRNPPKPKPKADVADGTRKVFMNYGAGWEEEVYDPNVHDVPRFRRHGEAGSHPCYKDDLEYNLCPKCRECSCGKCRLNERVVAYYSNQKEIVSREHLMLAMTNGKRPDDAQLDDEWCRQQDPIWAQLKDRNDELKEDIGKYIADLEEEAMSARDEMKQIHGIEYPATGVKTFLVYPFLNH